MTTQQIVEALTLITEAQKDTASVTVKIGTTYEGRVVHDCLIILDCPAAIIRRLSDKGYSMSMNEGELNIITFK